MKRFTLDTPVFYSQLVLFNNNIDYPFSDWTDNHVLQGFVWREGTISFGSLSEENNPIIHLTHLEDNESFKRDKEAMIQIALPLQVSSVIGFGSLFDTLEIEIPHGLYQVYFEAKKVKNTEIYNITLVKSDKPIAQVFSLENESNHNFPLFMEGTPAS